MDKKMNEKDFLPGEKLPIQILPVKDAWADIKNKLDDEMPGGMIGLQAGKPDQSKLLKKRIIRSTLLLLLLLSAWLFINQFNKGKITSNEISGTNRHTSNTGQPASEKTGTGSLSIKKSITPSEKEAGISSHINVNTPGSVPGSTNIAQRNSPVGNNRYRNQAPLKKKYGTVKMIRSSTKRQGQKPIVDSPANTNEIPADKGLTEQTIVNDSGKKEISSDNTTDTLTQIKKLPNDSIKNSAQNVGEQIPHYRPIVSAGLQWNFQLPVYSADNYFKSSSVTSRPYTVLLPGAWVSVQSENHMIRAEANPFYSNLLPEKPFGTFTTYSNVPDTIIIFTETKTLRKTFGVFISADYNLNFSSNWWIGGGVHAYWQRKGITSGRGTEEKRSLTTGGVVSNTFNKSYALTKTEWENFARFQIGLHGEVFYGSGRMQTGFRIGLPVTNVARQRGQKTPVRTEFIFRLPLFFSDERK